MTYTYAVLEVSRAAYDEIRQALNQAGYHHAFYEGGLIDMHGIALKTDKVDPYPWADSLGSASEEG